MKYTFQDLEIANYCLSRNDEKESFVLWAKQVKAYFSKLFKAFKLYAIMIEADSHKYQLAVSHVFHKLRKGYSLNRIIRDAMKYIRGYVIEPLKQAYRLNAEGIRLVRDKDTGQVDVQAGRMRLKCTMQVSMLRRKDINQEMAAKGQITYR